MSTCPPKFFLPKFGKTKKEEEFKRERKNAELCTKNKKKKKKKKRSAGDAAPCCKVDFEIPAFYFMSKTVDMKGEKRASK